MDIWTLLTGGGEEKNTQHQQEQITCEYVCVATCECVCVLCFHTQICGEPVSELARGHGRERRSARASASLCACFADVGVGRGGGWDGRGAGGCWCANVHHVEGLWMGRCDVKKGPERRCLSRGCQRHSMSYSWGLPFKATAPARLPRDWEEIKLFGLRH